jgi:hypothetical protein
MLKNSILIANNRLYLFQLRPQADELPMMFCYILEANTLLAAALQKVLKIKTQMIKFGIIEKCCLIK